jgi:hypothetical protein
MDHRVQKDSGVEPIEVEAMARAVGQKCQEGKLCPAVAFPEGMDSVELGEEVRGLACESLLRLARAGSVSA